ncbi:MAG: hypothetical protein JO048_05195 [Methylobacteriaceae bacterium]|nr:hypothetical protein [Methylobacteriaceae bacterium]
MSASKHARTKTPSDADLAGNPGIGTSKGTTLAGEDAETIEADSTFEGDVENEPNREGGVDPGHLGRTNR